MAHKGPSHAVLAAIRSDLPDRTAVVTHALRMGADAQAVAPRGGSNGGADAEEQEDPDAEPAIGEGGATVLMIAARRDLAGAC